jgi:ABC-type transporter Mla subunit MlaD
MPQRRGTSRTSGTGRAKRPASKPAGPKSMGQLEKALEAAESALKDLRQELGRGGREAVKDLNQTVKDARKHLRGLSKTVMRDLEKLQSAAGRGTASRPSGRSTRSTAARKSSTRSTTPRKSSPARKSPAKPRSPRSR